MKIKNIDHLRSAAQEIIFEAGSPAGKLFDVILIWSISLSVITVVLESVASFRESFGQFLNGLEWFFTIWIYQYSYWYLLGHCHPDDCRVWGCGPPNSFRKSPGIFYYDIGGGSL